MYNNSEGANDGNSAVDDDIDAGEIAEDVSDFSISQRNTFLLLSVVSGS